MGVPIKEIGNPLLRCRNPLKQPNLGPLGGVAKAGALPAMTLLRPGLRRFWNPPSDRILDPCVSTMGKATCNKPTYEPGHPLRCEVVAKVCPLPAELEAGHQVVVLPRVHAQHERLQYELEIKICKTKFCIELFCGCKYVAKYKRFTYMVF